MAAEKGNKYALGNNGGRPLIYDDPEMLHDKIIEYFEYIQGEGEERASEVPTINGLTLFLGFCNKSTLYDYAKKEEFSNSIKRALSVVELNYEEMLLSRASTGAIFALKNMGWTDKQEMEHKGGIDLSGEISVSYKD